MLVEASRLLVERAKFASIRHGIGVGAQSTLGGGARHSLFAQKYV